VSPRSSVAEASRTREAIVAEVVARASVEGLEGITIGTVADGLGMSKAGVVGPFGSKEELQLAALEGAIEIFRAEVWDRAADSSPGLDRLRAIAERWISYLERDGRVRDAVAATLRLWNSVLEAEARTAIEAGELDPSADPAQVAFELNAIAMAVNQARQLRADADAGRRGRIAMARALGPAR